MEFTEENTSPVNVTDDNLERRCFTMGEILEFFEAQLKIIENPTRKWDSSRISDSEMKAIEAELIRFADEFAIAN